MAAFLAFLFRFGGWILAAVLAIVLAVGFVWWCEVTIVGPTPATVATTTTTPPAPPAPPASPACDKTQCEATALAAIPAAERSNVLVLAEAKSACRDAGCQ